MKRYILFSALVPSTIFAGDTICPKVMSKGEGHWPIPESAFTQGAAKKATQNLSKYITKGTYGMDTIAIDNDILMIKGYLLKSRVKTDMPFVKEDFCDFIKNEAYVQH